MSTRVQDLIERHPWLPYAAPFLLFVALTGLQGQVPGGVAWVYPVKTVLTGLLILGLRRWLVPGGDWSVVASTVTGVVVLVLWILPDGHYPLLGTPTEFDPFAHFTRAQAFVWIAFRLVGTALIVPIVEEFFWRGFLIRWLVKADFRSVPMGTFTWYSFLATSVLFAVEHFHWLPGLFAGVVYNLLWYRTRSLKACILAHAVTNLGLGIWVLATGQWRFW